MSSLHRRRVEGVIVPLVGYFLVRAFWMVSNAAGGGFASATIEATAKIVLWGGASLLIGSWLARRHGTSLSATLGLGRGLAKGLAFGLAATVPMIAALGFSQRADFDLDMMFGSGLLGPFAEEMLFRGFLFGLLWRAMCWPAPAAIAVSALLFGFAHQINVLPMVAGGAVLGWIAYRWNSLWPAIVLHACMNLYWDLLRVEHTRPSLGPDLMSVAQILSVALAVGLTLRFSTSGRSGAPGSSGTSGARNELTLVNDL